MLLNMSEVVISDLDGLLGRVKGRFVGFDTTSSCTMQSRRKKTSDDSWIIRNTMLRGLIESSVIPSYGGDVARRIWEGKERKLMKC